MIIRVIGLFPLVDIAAPVAHGQDDANVAPADYVFWNAMVVDEVADRLDASEPCMYLLIKIDAEPL